MSGTNFPNGITSYLETHYVISSTIEELLRTDTYPSILNEIHEKGGVFDVMNLARDLTDKFENEFHGFDWDSSNESWLEKLPVWVSNQLNTIS